MFAEIVAEISKDVSRQIIMAEKAKRQGRSNHRCRLTEPRRMLQMSTINPADMLVESALKVWKLNEIRFARVFHALSEVELQREIAPERNRLIYIWGHVVAVNDGLFPLLGIGPRLYPELENTFLLQPDPDGLRYLFWRSDEAGFHSGC